MREKWFYGELSGEIFQKLGKRIVGHVQPFAPKFEVALAVGVRSCVGFVSLLTSRKALQKRGLRCASCYLKILLKG